MAEENIVTNIVAKSDFSNLIGDLNKVSSRLAALQQQLSNTNKTLSVQASQMQKAFADTMRSTGQFSTHFVSLTSDVDKFGKSLDSGQMKLGQYYRTWQQHAKTSGGLIRQLAAQQVQLQNAVMQPLGKNAQGLMQFNVHIPQGLDKIKNSAALARQEMQIMNKVIQDGANQVINWGKNTQWAGRQLSVGLTLPIAAFGKAAADAFKQADQELVRLTKVYGGVAATSAADLAKIRKEVAETAKQMSSEYGASYKETIALAADIAATGKQGNELLVATQETTRLSVLGEVDRQEAMKATLAIQSAFKQNTTELSESINFLNAVENQTSTSLADLVEAIPKAGPVVKALGGDVQDLALYLTAMREGGINASEGANALKSALASIINPTKVAKEQFAGFGINLEGIVNKNAGNLTGTILEIQAALETLDPLKKSKAIEQLFGKFQFARMNALFENLGKQGSQTLQVLDLMKASSEDLANVAGRELSQITESASGRYKRALESLKADLAGVGEQFLNIATKFINVLDSVIKFFNKLPSPVKTIMSVVTGLTALTGPIIMLTGLMANFFGYIAKGLFHFKALIKGGEGFKLLTPEILAAEKAGSLMETTFYDDAKAAAILQKAISNLTAELSLLEVKANSARTAVGPSIKTTAGSVIIEGADRVVDPNHPKLGKPYTRASSHVNPLGDMTTDQRSLQNIFSFVPGTEPVNRDIGKNPQMYMQSDLPKVEGVSAFKGTSSGIVAQEAAKWHAMTAAIAMQSEAEIKTLKAEVAATGTITHELSSSYQALLPPMTEITSLAAAESAAIVAELQMGKTTVDQARAKIIALNANVEAMLAETAAATAAGMGRTANITTVPLTNQPVVDPLTGKSNMREMFKKNSGVVDRIARILGVKTSGGSYSIETTKPKRFATGGSVVPGNGNSDTVPAMLTPGEFVINKEATAANLPLLQAINGNGSSGNRLNKGSSNPLEGLQRGHISNDLSAFMLYMDTDTNQRVVRGRKYQGNDGITGFEIAKSLSTLKKRTGMHPASLLNNLVRRMGGDSRYVEQMYHDIVADLASPQNRNRVFGGLSGESFEDFTEKHLSVLKNSKLPNGSNVFDELKRVRTERVNGRSANLSFDGSRVSKTNALMDANGRPITRSLLGTSSGLRGSIIDDLLNFSLGPNANKPGASIESHGRKKSFLGMPLQRTQTGWAKYGFAPDLIRDAMSKRMQFSPRLFRNKGGVIGLNAGGMVPNNSGGTLSNNSIKGYARGGVVGQTLLSTAGSLGGGMLGNMLGGQMGMMAGSMLGGMLPMGMGRRSSNYDIPEKSILATTKYGNALSNAATSGSKLGSILPKMLLGITKLNAGIAIGSVVVGAAYTLWKKHQEELRLNTLGYGLTAEAASKAGLKFKSFNSTMKDTVENIKAMKEKNDLVYQSLTMSNTPLNMTIEQYKKLKKEVQSVYSDQVKLINQSKDGDLADVAIRIKEQLVAAGMAADEATKKIYAMFKVSNKSSEALSATIKNSAFNKITDAVSAAEAAINSYAKATSTVGGKQQAAQLNTALMAIDSASPNSEKEQATLERINKLRSSGVKITQATINELAKTNPIITEFANTQDTVVSLWQKIKLATAGYVGDLSKLSAEQTAALSKASAIINKSTVQTTQNGILKSQYANLKKLTDLRTKYENASKGQSVSSQIDSRKVIDSINKEIDAINKRAEAKKKALQDEQTAEDYVTQLKRKQMEYTDAIAAGDMSRASQAQLDINQLTSTRQRSLAVDAIDTQAKSDIAKLEGKKSKIEAANQNLADNASLAGEGLGKLTEKIDKQKAQIDGVNTALSSFKLNLDAWLVKNTGKTEADYIKTKEGRGLAAGITQSYKDAGLGTPKSEVPSFINNWKGKSAADIGLELSKNTNSAISSALEKSGIQMGSGDIIINGQKVDMTKNNKNKSNKSSYPYPVYGQGMYPYRTHAAGGHILGPGNGTSDSIPAMLSNGEYVINAKSVQAAGLPMLDKINKMALGGLATRFDIPRSSMGRTNFANGGSATSSNALYNINVNVAGTNANPNDIARAISQEMRLREAMNGVGRRI